MSVCIVQQSVNGSVFMNMTDEIEPHYRRFRQFSGGERRTRIELSSLDGADDAKSDRPSMDHGSVDSYASEHERTDKTSSSVDMKLFEKVSGDNRSRINFTMHTV